MTQINSQAVGSNKAKIVGLLTSLPTAVVKKAKNGALRTTIRRERTVTFDFSKRDAIKRKKYNFNDYYECLDFLALHVPDVKISASSRIITKKVGSHGLRVLACLDALKNHHQFRIIEVKDTGLVK